MIKAKQLIGSHDLLLITIDALRYDVARDTLKAGRTPNLAKWLPGGIWERRHSPGNFTYSAHQAFFAGFFPTPEAPGRHPRLFAARFPGSETTDADTFVFDAENLPAGLAARGYRTVCVGGVGFFNKCSPLGSVFPNLFQESYWSPELGVTDRRSTEHQMAIIQEIVSRVPRSQRLFLFLNVSAIHQPNHFYLPGTEEDSLASHTAALEYVDRHLPTAFEVLQQRGPTLCILCSDHGTAYGEDGYFGHRIAHPVVWTVPYAEFVLPESDA